jgi:hypothetical protein
MLNSFPKQARFKQNLAELAKLKGKLIIRKHYTKSKTLGTPKSIAMAIGQQRDFLKNHLKDLSCHPTDGELYVEAAYKAARGVQRRNEASATTNLHTESSQRAQKLSKARVSTGTEPNSSLWPTTSTNLC